MDHSLLFCFLHQYFSPLFIANDIQGLTILGISILIFLILSYFVSGAEVAFFSLTYKDLNLLKTKQGTGWKRIVGLLDEPQTLLGSLRIANVLLKITIITLANFLIDALLPIKDQHWFVALGTKIAIVTVFLLLFGEILPKVYATQNNIRFARDSSYLVEIVNLVFRRISIWMFGLTESAEKIARSKDGSHSLEELDHAIDLSTRNDGAEEAKNILKGIAKFGNITVKQIMRTRLDVSGVNYNISFADLILKIEELHYSRLPVYKNSLDDVVGIVHSKDILQFIDEPLGYDWHILIRQPFFVHEQKLIEDLLHEFQLKRIHFAVVVDEFGGTSGIVTLEDIMEEIIGDIKDEFDDEDSPNRKIDDANYVFEGRTMINDACRMMQLAPDTFETVRGDADSLAGLLLELAGKIPKQHDVITVGDFAFTVIEIEKNRIQSVQVTITQQTEE